ncbi:ABC transporter ATP-binding protein [Paenibacillus psychroresistens]|uniref:ABC transporter ATP-binding protein n=1 Tax=Paenibacillus psychroresistens TaxID=1778678 RepID=A0A6B8RS04_9BACL|nr:ABC transporter ATP-binding protein [Paenibacillus psychroresistens]QGQ98028.1 ABC transporter ATP-binding protein [Paenibacillus psychroresistens]
MNHSRILLNYFKLNWPVYSFAILLMIISNIDQATIPLILGRFTDDLQKGDISRHAIMNYSVLLLVVGISYGLFFGFGQFLVARLGRKFEFMIRQRIFQKFSVLNEHYFSKQGMGKLLSYVMNDVTAVRESISQGVNQTTNAVFLILSSIVMMLISAIPVYLIAICICPMVIIPFIVVYFGPQIRLRSMQVQESLATMTGSAEEQLSGIRVTKTFAIEGLAQKRFDETVDQIRDAQLRLVRMSSLFQAILPFLGAFSLIFSIVLGGYLTIKHSITLGDFVALTLYLRLIVNPLQQLGNVINTMQRSRASLERMNNLLEEVPDIREAANAKKLDTAGHIQIRQLSFNYPGSDRAVLNNIDLKIRSGTTLGIVGKTGSGKTTLVKLLLRVYESNRGSIQFNGVDIQDITLESLRSRIAYVPQDGFLFSTTIRDNIAFSDREAKLEDVEIAAQQAFIHESILHFTDHFETKLGERGVTLSGGQKQRTSLARGLLKKAPILILDDSVSAVDSLTEAAILKSLRKLRKNKTTLIISHRISAVKHADEIIVMNDGKIVQRGTHEQLLLELDGEYASLNRIQEEGLEIG